MATQSPDREPFRMCVETFTPERAAYLLENKHPKNRNVKRSNVEFLKRVARSARGLVIANDCICFDWFGNLINGQHRMIMCVETGIPMTQPVIYGLDPETFLAMDRGSPRMISTDFQMDNFPYASSLAATIGIIFRFDNNKMQSNVMKLLPEQAQEFVYNNPDVCDMVRSANSSLTRRKSWIASPSVASSAWFIFNRIDAQMASEFIERWSDGAGLEPGHPVLALRSHLLNRKSQIGVTIAVHHQLAIAIKAWNAFRGDRKVPFLKFITNEDFPVPV